MHKTNKNVKGKQLIILLGVFLFFIASLMPQYLNDSYISETEGSKMYLDMEDPQSLKKAGFWTLTSIHIDNNWTTTNSTYSWVNGKGTWDEPYIIENVTVDNLNQGNGILIENSNEYFIIRNSTIKNAFSSSSYAGIWLSNVGNGTITESQIYDNYYGIVIWPGSNNTVSFNNISNNNNSLATPSGTGLYLRSSSNNNTIFNNTIMNNGDYGIYLRSTCDYNNISKNIIFGNRNNGIYFQSASDLDSGNYNTIRENIFENNGIDGSGSPGGMYFRANTTKIVGNSFINNYGYGVWMRASYWNNFSNNIVTNNTLDGFFVRQTHNSTFTKNFVQNNSLYGINIDITFGNSYNNLLYNNFLNGSGSGNVDDNGINTVWNNSQIGNYWSDYSGSDGNGDGIGDSIYNVPGGSNNDTLPIYESPVHNGSRVLIDDTGTTALNWSQTALVKWWVPGSGTQNDP